jgi:flavin-dependent dehydrogenase
LHDPRPTTPHPRFSVAIIGAGPAGSIAALLLARAGINVTLIEQHRFPRDKVCGECISALGIDVLRRLRLSDALLKHTPAVLNRTILFATNGSLVEIELPQPMWGISRLVFDQILLNAAQSAGAKIHQPARCEAIENGWRIRDLESNQVRNLDADYVIVADGKGSPTADMGLKAHFTNVAAANDAIELFSVAGHYGGIAPIENGMWNIAFSVPQSRVRASRGNLDALFTDIIAENVSLSQQMRSANRVSDWLVSPLPRFAAISDWPENVIPIGNAAAAVEPIGGEGMGLAMCSAELAANFLIDAFCRKIPVDVMGLQTAYRKLWRVRRFACRAAAMAVSCPTISRAIPSLVQNYNPLTSLALRAIGKF